MFVKLLVGTAAFTLAACAPGSDGQAEPAADAALNADAPDGLPATCEGACRITNLTASFGATTRLLDRAHYGITKSATGDTLHVEAYGNAAAGCPTETSPPPDYTLVLGTVPIPASAEASTSPGNILDFVGDLLGGSLGAAATSVTITPVAANVCSACVGMPPPSDAAGLVALDVTLEFAAGTVTGHLFATHCDSLDAQP